MPTAQTVQWERETYPVTQWTRQEEDRDLKAEIEQATEHLLTLADNWDDEGSPAYSKEALARAAYFLTAHSAKGHDLCSSYPPAPRIGPGPNGSIDLHWKQEKWELLVNIPANDTQMAVFYGDDYGAAKIKGSFDPKAVNLGIVNWLMH
jgi:hypothetical protein